MMSRAPSQSPAASFKPRLPAPASALKPPLALRPAAATSRRGLLLLVPSLATASAVLRTLPSAVAADADAPTLPPPAPTEEAPSPAVAEAEEPKESTMSRVYDASVLGEPEAVTGKEARRRVWEKLAAARVVYLGEAEVAPDPDDRALELEIVKGLETRCADAGRGLALVLEAFPCDLQQQLDQFMDGRYCCSPSMFYFSTFISETVASDSFN
jgi:hypothetical protein